MNYVGLIPFGYIGSMTIVDATSCLLICSTFEKFCSFSFCCLSFALITTKNKRKDKDVEFGNLHMFFFKKKKSALKFFRDVKTDAFKI